MVFNQPITFHNAVLKDSIVSYWVVNYANRNAGN